jgi:hypothetical protein
MGRLVSASARAAFVCQDGLSWSVFLWFCFVPTSLVRGVPLAALLIMSRRCGDAFLSAFGCALLASWVASVAADVFFLAALNLRGKTCAYLLNQMITILRYSLALFFLSGLFAEFSFFHKCVIGCASWLAVVVWTSQLIWTTNRNDVLFGMRFFGCSFCVLAYDSRLCHWLPPLFV